MGVLHMLKKTLPNGEVLFRKKGGSDYHKSWSKDGHAWASSRCFKLFIGHHRGSRYAHRGAWTIIDKNKDYLLEVVIIDHENSSIETKLFEQWCIDNGVDMSHKGL